MKIILIITGVIFFLILLIFIFLLSTINIDIQNLHTGNINKTYKNYKVNIKLKFLNIIPVISINLNDKRIKKIYNNSRLKKIKINEIKNMILDMKKIIKLFGKLKIKFERLNLISYIGVEDVIATSYLVAGISTIIANILPHAVESKNIKNCKYEIISKYEQKNVIDVYLDCIITVKIVNTIYVLYKLQEKGSNKNERTSNRRSYDYSNGIY